MGIGPWQIILILVIVVLLFGGKKIPEVAKGIGQGIREFKDAMNAPPAEDKDKKSEKTEEKS